MSLGEPSEDEFEIITLKSGVKSLRSLKNLETFHPVTGPKLEAAILHVGQQRLAERCAVSGRFVLWDVGLGAAANVLAAIEALRGCKAQVEIYSFDRSTAPLAFAMKNDADLGYLSAHETHLRELLACHVVQVDSNIRWHLRLGDFGAELESSVGLPAPNAIFYDPYSPLGNPEMWSLEHFRMLRSRLNAEVPCLLSNYTRSTAVRVTLLLAGFYVGIGCEVGEKAETTIATNRFELLERPLDRVWLKKRVLISGNAAPLGSRTLPQAPISPKDFERLRQCPQFGLSV